MASVADGGEHACRDAPFEQIPDHNGYKRIKVAIVDPSASSSVFHAYGDAGDSAISSIDVKSLHLRYCAQSYKVSRCMKDSVCNLHNSARPAIVLVREGLDVHRCRMV